MQTTTHLRPVAAEAGPTDDVGAPRPATAAELEQPAASQNEQQVLDDLVQALGQWQQAPATHPPDMETAIAALLVGLQELSGG